MLVQGLNQTILLMMTILSAPSQINIVLTQLCVPELTVAKMYVYMVIGC